MSQWFEDESFWNALYPVLFPDRRFEVAEDEVRSVLELTGIGEGDALDLACGPGRHSVALAKAGFRVAGVDLSPFLLQKAADLADANEVEVEWVQGDMRHFLRPEAFDLVVSMFTSFGYFDDKNDDMTTLRNICQNLRSGGTLVMELMGKEILARGFLPTTSQELSDGRLLVQRRDVSADWTLLKNEWILIEDSRATTHRFHHTVYSGQELRDRLLGSGFTDVQLFGDLDGSEYGPKARRLVAVARKLR